MVLAFLRFQIQQFDKFHKKAEKYAVDAESTSGNNTNHVEGLGSSGTTSKTDQIITLGVKQNVLTIKKLLESQSADPAFMSFCQHVSLVIQALICMSDSKPADTIIINDSQEVQSFVS